MFFKNKYFEHFVKIKTLLTLPRMIFLILIFSSFWLRFINLGYSDYQGDEIKAFWSPKSSDSTWSYLLNQRKGPMQFFFTWAIKLIFGGYESYFLTRLPFAVAGFISVILIYYISLVIFKNKIVAFCSAFLFSFNGFFVAFSRIVQYQSLVIFFGLLSVFLLLKAVENNKYKNAGFILSFISWSLGILSHYDSLLLFPIILYFSILWFKKYKNYKVLLFTFIIFITIVSSFYIPFILNPKFKIISAYLQNRVSGELGVQPKLPTMELFKIYNPKFLLTFYMILFSMGIVMVKKSWPLLIWFIPSFIAMELLVKLPGTHIYTYLIPLTILCGAGFGFIYDILGKFIKYSLLSVLVITLTFNFYQSHFVFIDTAKDYPYSDTRFLIWHLIKPNTNYSLPLFGFPYNRHWQNISFYIKSQNPSARFSSNEEKQISRYYLNGNKRTPKNAQYYIRINNSQSFVKDTNRSGILQNIQSTKPEKVFYNQNKIVAEIYNLKPTLSTK